MRGRDKNEVINKNLELVLKYTGHFGHVCYFSLDGCIAELWIVFRDAQKPKLVSARCIEP